MVFASSFFRLRWFFFITPVERSHDKNINQQAEEEEDKEENYKPGER